ncbi:MAG: ion channel [Bacteroidota bacterium]|nr:ion channel [Bacteroidota bacterium]
MFHKKQNKNTEPPKDLGFGTQVQSGQGRLINNDGSFNVQRKGLNLLERLSFYHQLIAMPWWKFNMLVFLVYFVANLLFASIYCIIGLEHLGGISPDAAIWDKFWEAFFFSAQTLTTVGYGRVNPVGVIASTVSAIESLSGLLGFALATGLIYGRFARPVANILFSKTSIIAPYRDINAWMFRMTNARDNQLIEVEVQVNITYIKTIHGKPVRQYTALDLERNKVTMFPTTWTIVHPLTDKSPLYNVSLDELKDMQVEFMVMVKAFDEAFSTNVHSRYSYITDEVAYGEKFVNIHETSHDGKTLIRLDRLDLREPAQLHRNSIYNSPKERD